MAERPRLSAFLHPRYWSTWLGFGLQRLLACLPLPLVALAGAGIGMLLYALHAPRRHVARINLARCFPELSRRRVERLVRRHFRAFGQTLLDVAIAWWAGPARLRRLVCLRNRRYYDDARRAGRNVILLAPHFIGLEIGGIRLSLETPLLSVFRQTKNKLVAALMRRGRMRFGAKLIEHNRPFTALVREVKLGTAFYYLPDQDAGDRHAAFAPFFGIPAATFTTLTRLARMTGAVVIPCITYQRAWGRGYEIVFQPPLAHFPSADVLTDTARMNTEIEHAVRALPEQYFWLHQRFKTRPRGAPKFY